MNILNAIGLTQIDHDWPIVCVRVASCSSIDHGVHTAHHRVGSHHLGGRVVTVMVETVGVGIIVSCQLGKYRAGREGRVVAAWASILGGRSALRSVRVVIVHVWKVGKRWRVGYLVGRVLLQIGRVVGSMRVHYAVGWAGLIAAI